MKSIYLIDDDPIYALLMRKSISNVRPDIEISEFDDAELALCHIIELSRNQKPLPDIIFLDLSMPVTDGWEFITKFAHLKTSLINDIKLYIVSSSISASDLKRSMEYNVV